MLFILNAFQKEGLKAFGQQKKSITKKLIKEKKMKDYNKPHIVDTK